ncbi:hypothetical protein CerSpe_173670 [Prunus speciosa]
MMFIQQLIDCNASNYGCSGGNKLKAYDYIIQNGGLNTKQNYPYRGIKGTCDAIKERGDGLNINTYAILTSRIEDKLAYALYEQPMVVGVDAHSSKFEKYKGRIFHEECVTKLPMTNTR